MSTTLPEAQVNESHHSKATLHEKHLQREKGQSDNFFGSLGICDCASANNGHVSAKTDAAVDILAEHVVPEGDILQTIVTMPVSYR